MEETRGRQETPVRDNGVCHGGWAAGEGPPRLVSFCPVVNTRCVYVKLLLLECVHLLRDSHLCSFYSFTRKRSCTLRWCSPTDQQLYLGGKRNRLVPVVSPSRCK